MKGIMDEDYKERKERIESMRDAPPGAEVGIFVAEQSDPLGLGAVKLDNGEWASPLVVPPIRCPQPGNRVMTLFNAVENKLYWSPRSPT